MFTIGLIILLFALPKTRPFMVGLTVVIGLGILVGLISPDFFLEEPVFWVCILLVFGCLIMLWSYISDWDKEERDRRTRL